MLSTQSFLSRRANSDFRHVEGPHTNFTAKLENTRKESGYCLIQRNKKIFKNAIVVVRHDNKK